MKDKEIKIRANEDFIEKVDYLQKINGYKNRSETVRKVIEKEHFKEMFVSGNPTIINITGINGKGYVKILKVSDFPTYSRYDLDAYDEHGDAISVYIPKKEKGKNGKNDTINGSISF